MNKQHSTFEEFRVGDILICDRFKDCLNVPYVFKTHKVDPEFGVVYYKYKGKEDTIGFSYVRKANFLEKVTGWFRI